MKGLKLYKDFIDKLVLQKEGVYRNWILQNGYPKTEENKGINDFLNELSSEQKVILAAMLIDARQGGMHDVLAQMDEMIDLEELNITQDGEKYPTEYFDSMHFDFIARCEVDEWPE